jgi:hypothetical protein
MHHEQAIDVDAVLLQSRGVRHEWRSNPSDPFLEFGGIVARQCLQGRHQQTELAYAVPVDEYFGNVSERPPAAGQMTIELVEPRWNNGASNGGPSASPHARIRVPPFHGIAE